MPRAVSSLLRALPFILAAIQRWVLGAAAMYGAVVRLLDRPLPRWPWLHVALFATVPDEKR